MLRSQSSYHVDASLLFVNREASVKNLLRMRHKGQMVGQLVSIVRVSVSNVYLTYHSV